MTVSAFRFTVLLLLVGTAPGICSAQGIPATASGRFDVLDRNRDGVVSKHEYSSESLFAAMDADRNNRLSATELEAALGPQSDGGLSAADRIRIADSNSDGELTDEELRRAVEMRFVKLDSNHDDNVDLAELKSGFGRP